MHFGLDNGRTISLEPNGIRPTILGERRDYECFDPDFRSHGGQKWTIKYDPDDLSTALAVNEDGSLHYLLEAKELQPMALVDRQPGDEAKLERVRAYNKALLTSHVEHLEACRETAREVLDQVKIKGFLGAHLIIDSKGQHKNQRSKELAAAPEDAEYEEQYEDIVTSQPESLLENEEKLEKKWLKKL